MGRPQVTEIRCKSALNRVRGMPFKWSLNPYRGCEHACSYCYARASHEFLGLNAGDDFSTQIMVKTNVADVLRQELGRRSWAREPVALGTATDPYQPVEGRYRLSRACLEALADHHTPGNVTTKGTLIVRDVDVLQHLAARAGGGVSMSLITLDEAIWRAVEPGTPPPRQRLAAMARLAQAGVPCGLALAPVLPGLTDSPAALERVVRAAAGHGAQWLWCGAVHLEPVVRDWFLGALAHHFPAAVPAYARVYGAAGSAAGAPGARYAPRAYTARLTHQVGELKQRYGLAERRHPARTLQSSLPGTPAPGPASSGPVAHQMALPL
jgi:DNA repair photolyase